MALTPLPTAWTNIPPHSGDQSAAYYSFWIQCWLAQQEKHAMIGNLNEGITKKATGWAGGTIGGFTDNGDTYTLTDGTGHGSTGWNTFTVLNGPTDVAEFLPNSWDVIISYDTGEFISDPRLQVRTQLVGHTTGDGSSAKTITVKAYKDYVTCGLIPTVNCVGKRFACVHRAGGGGDGGQYGMWSPGDVMNPGSSRWPDPPLDREDDKGTFHSAISSSGIVTAILDSVADTPTKKRVIIPGTLVGKEILFSADNYVRRCTILSNSIDATTKQTLIVFAWTGSTPGGSYTIGAPGFVQIPGRDAGHPFLWYSGQLQEWYTHSPDDPQIPQLFPTVGKDEIVFCDDTDADAPDACEDCLAKGPLGHAFNNDLWADPQSVCGNADLAYQPFIFKSINGVISDQEAWMGSFIPDLAYPVDGYNPTQGYTVPTAFLQANINASVTSMHFDATSSTWIANVGSAYEGVTFTVLKTNPKYRQDRWKDMSPANTSAAVVNGVITIADEAAYHTNQNEIDNPANWSDEGSMVVYTGGRTRYFYKMVRNIYTRYGFIVDTDFVDGVSVPIYKPSIDFAVSGCTGIGQWVKRDPSGSTLEFTADGSIGGGKAFRVNDIALYMGESWEYQIDPGANGDQIEPGDLQWHDGFAEAVHPELVQRKIVLDTTGTVTSGNKYSLTCTDKNWYSNWYNGGIQRTESGTVSAATSTSITDSTKTTGPVHCWWQDGRFIQGGTWEFFVLELTDTNTTPHTVWKVPITGGNNITCTVNFAAVPGMTPLGDGTWTYNINEPDKVGLARYRNRKCTISRPDGSSFQVTILTNDATTLFFAPQTFEIQADWRFKIDEIYPGSLVKWDGSKWNLYSTSPITVIPPDIIKSYDRTVHKFDLVGIHIFDEFRRVSDLLYMKKVDGAFSEGRGILSGCVLQTACPEDLSGDADQPNRVVRTIHEMQSTVDANWPYDGNGGPLASLTQFPETTFGFVGQFWGDCTGFDASSDDGNPRCEAIWAAGTGFNPSCENFIPLLYRLSKEQIQYRAHFSGVPTLISSTIDSYAYAVAAEGDPDEGTTTTRSIDPGDGTTVDEFTVTVAFEAGGTPFKFREWVKWDSGGSVDTDGTGVSSDWLGSLQLPGWVGNVTGPVCVTSDEPAYSSVSTEGFGGYNCTAHVSLARFAGNFHK